MNNTNGGFDKKNGPGKATFAWGIFATFMVLERLIFYLTTNRGLEIVELFHNLQF